MSNEQWITQINSKQRQDMLSKGLSPLNPQHIKKYLQEGGRIKASSQDLLERAKTLIGAENIHSLGSGHEKEISFNPTNGQGLAGYDVEEFEQIQSKPVSVKQSREDMLGNYGTRNEVITNVNLLNLKEETNTIRNKPVTNTSYEDQGYKNTIKYLNDFILLLKQPSTQLRINVFNSLKITLQGENNLKNNKNALQAYRNGCLKAEQQMYHKLTK